MIFRGQFRGRMRSVHPADASGVRRRRIALLCLVVVALPSVADGDLLRFDDPLASQQYHHDQMRFGEAWGTIHGLERRGQVTVAVLDSGFETDHDDLGNNLMRGINIIDGSSDVSPVHPHGTGTSGIPGAISGNASGVSQAALTARVLPVRISDRSDGAAYISDIAQAIRFAADAGARIINISYGGVGNRTVAKAARYAYRKGALVFMAAGNSGLRTRWRNYRHIVAVGSIGSDNVRSNFSTYGRFVDFVAPGEQITTLYTDDDYADWDGTSFSSPIVASVASLVLAANLELSPAQVLRILRKTATRLARTRRGRIKRGRDKEYGYGLPDAQAAVEMALATRGRYGRKLRRRGIDPYVENDWSPYAGIVSTTAARASASALVRPQGILRSTISARPAPEPGTLMLMLLALVALALRPRRRTAVVRVPAPDRFG
ncbi:MAG: hypothetical protein CMJ18_15705 [Phycisphaeraceae bacterium]|nr:hypothetical protein [Phycisphaeraceae bacterium]